MKTKRMRLWDDEYEESQEESVEKTVKTSINKNVDSFARYQNDILDQLRTEYDKGQRLKSFDENRIWRRVASLAWFYFWRDEVKKRTVTPRERRKRLGELADDLKHVISQIALAMQDDVGDDLFATWLDANDQ